MKRDSNPRWRLGHVLNCHLKCSLLCLLILHCAHCCAGERAGRNTHLGAPTHQETPTHSHPQTGSVGISEDESAKDEVPVASDDRSFSLAQSSTRREAEIFIDQLFTKYGEKGVMTFEGFEHLLQSLGIGNITITDHDLKDHYTESGFVEFHENHQHILINDKVHLGDSGHDHENDGNDHSNHDHKKTYRDHEPSNHDHEHSNHDHEHSNHDHDHSNQDHHHSNHDHEPSNQEEVAHHHHVHERDSLHGNPGSKDESRGTDRKNRRNRNRDRSNKNTNRNRGTLELSIGSHYDDSSIDTDGRPTNHGDHDHVTARPAVGSQGKKCKNGQDHGKDHSHDHSHHSHSTHRDDNGRKEGLHLTLTDDKVYGHSHQTHHEGNLDHDHSSHHPHTTRKDSEPEDLFEWYDFFGFPKEDSEGRGATNPGGPENLETDSDFSRTDAELTRDASDYFYEFFGNDGEADYDGSMAGRSTRTEETPTDVSPTARSARKQGSTHPTTQEGSHNPEKPTRQKRATDISEATDYLNERKCLTAQEILRAYHIIIQRGITKDDFVNLCPAMVYQIDQHACADDVIPVQCLGLQGRRSRECIAKYSHSHGSTKSSVFDIKPKVWGYAILAVTIISLVGLLSVAIVPLMRKVFFNYLIQFLVALAIGSLTGDALLHLIPHAMDSSHGSHEGSDLEGPEGHGREGVFKGVVILLGIYLFFVMERLMDYFTERRQKRRKVKELEANKFYIRAPVCESIGEKLSHHDMQKKSFENIVIPRPPPENVPEILDTSDCQDSTRVEVTFEGQMKATEEGHKGHGHSHGVPDSIAAIAWMVIAGDGLHNFSDGLAIGAAFANSITGGLSTAVAVFCHELPHELGDFAVLLRAGMSVRQALFYNIVSSVLCVFGMVIGVIIGNINEASLWIFALTAGIFIYISLVDMLPEITNPEIGSGESRAFFHLAQFLGITCGVTVMLLIALFEEKIRLDLQDSQL